MKNKIFPLFLVCSAFALAGCEWVTGHDTSRVPVSEPSYSYDLSEESDPQVESDPSSSDESDSGVVSDPVISSDSVVGSDPISSDSIDLSDSISLSETSVESLTSAEEEMITYTIYNLPSWMRDYGVEVFVWAWDYNNEGAWYGVTFGAGDPATEMTFKTPTEMKGCLVVRCYIGTTQPDWSIHEGDVVGRIYSQTEDINISISNFAYGCPDFFDYPAAE